ncbi:carbohydrate ABC transporter ATP-binding protein (CUT1 family) [Kushneria sinocarnis]|uniref:Carbohydrate ABC transporter ATP-binding protein (CUT1 family) n=1 Tax=Kushneria sinocarnis TaxID=595502 RepID=A0A420WTR3_9GAMM|nr:ABC transporter ATP-binding protein [Kushneria sinocarnis]RKQ96883.1 carbohydrate ABC transporter ATP-binding protein (CUT1 family) [Kushneria sinocarnis]
MAVVELKNVVKRYGGGLTGKAARSEEAPAVDDFNLVTEDGEFVVLVGPSGCGKSTTMRMIAGLEDNTEGEIRIGGRDVSDVAARDRDIAMVFQSYALYPHMSVFENMAFSLRLKKAPKSEIDQRVNEAASILDITHLLDRKPRALSGGQRQRVALGRAIVRQPQVFLMDEPLSNLDAKLRVDMRAEIVKLHRKLGVTTFYVTHDQTEAMTMGQRIVVMRDGRIQQIDTPNALYARPANMFVAGFIGTPSMNFMKMRVGDDTRSLKGETARFRAGDAFTGDLLDSHRGQEVWVGIRPEHLQHHEGDAGALENGLSGTVDVVEPLGSVTMVQLEIDGHRITAQLEGDTRARSGDTITLTCESARLHLFDVVSEQALARQPVESAATA